MRPFLFIVSSITLLCWTHLCIQIELKAIQIIVLFPDDNRVDILSLVQFHY